MTPKSEKITVDTSSSILSHHAPIISIRGEINEETAENFRDAVETLLFERNTEMGLIEINSPGGGVLETMEILNIMKGSKIAWATYNASYAMSGAAIILSAGEPGRRFTSPLSTIMIHELSGDTGWGHITEIKSSAKWLDQVNNMIIETLCDNCGITRTEYAKRMKANEGHDLYLTPHEAKKFGIIDEVAIMSLAQAQAYSIELVHMAKEKVDFDRVLTGKTTKKPPVKKK